MHTCIHEASDTKQIDSSVCTHFRSCHYLTQRGFIMCDISFMSSFTYIYTHLHTYIKTQKHTYMRVHACIHYISSKKTLQKHTYIHAYIHQQTQMYQPSPQMGGHPMLQQWVGGGSPSYRPIEWQFWPGQVCMLWYECIYVYVFKVLRWFFVARNLGENAGIRHACSYVGGWVGVWYTAIYIGIEYIRNTSDSACTIQRRSESKCKNVYVNMYISIYVYTFTYMFYVLAWSYIHLLI